MKNKIYQGLFIGLTFYCVGLCMVIIKNDVESSQILIQEYTSLSTGLISHLLLIVYGWFGMSVSIIISLVFYILYLNLSKSKYTEEENQQRRKFQDELLYIVPIIYFGLALTIIFFVRIYQ